MDTFNDNYEFIEQLLLEHDTYTGDRHAFIERWAHLLGNTN